jgi:hypothetical protein
MGIGRTIFSPARKQTRGITITLLAIAFVVLSPIILPAAFFWRRRYETNLRRLAQSTKCRNCGNLLGLESLRIADAAVSSEVDEFRRQHPGSRYRCVRTLHAICPRCDTSYTFFEKENELGIRLPPSSECPPQIARPARS